MESRASTSPRGGRGETALELAPSKSVLDGADSNYALHQDDLDRGYVLTCQSHATSPKLVVGLRRLSAVVSTPTRRRPPNQHPSENWSP